MLYWLIVIAGVIFLLVQIFLSTGGKAKFKSDLPKTKELTKKRKVVIVCSSILCVISLVLLIVALISWLL